MTKGREDSADARPGGANRRPRLTEGTMGRNPGVLNSRKAPFDLLSKYHLGAPCTERTGLHWSEYGQSVRRSPR